MNRGVAYESELLVVKMGNARENSFPRTTELMEGIDYLVRQAVQMGKPIAINISFGNNYGSHQGDSLLETYISNVGNVGRLSFVLEAEIMGMTESIRRDSCVRDRQRR